ncbi:MAG: hypothetical protein LBP40_06450 [Campylobacteraceae bacterium]|jgi:hypothetical protein|nr:hypothetical protein [Campylobacteraceae bacterium]
MLTLFSIIYGPLVIWLTDSFSEKTSAVVVLALSGVLIIMHAAKRNPVWIIPFVYFLISLSTLFFGKIVWLQFGPLAVSLGVAILLSMRVTTTLLVKNFVKNQRFFPNIKEEQIFFTAPIWMFSAWINVLLHVGFLIFASRWLWAFYVSVGWYTVFALGAILCIYLQKRRYG